MEVAIIKSIGMAPRLGKADRRFHLSDILLPPNSLRFEGQLPSRIDVCAAEAVLTFHSQFDVAWYLRNRFAGS